MGRINLAGMSNDELLDQFSENPKSVLTSVAEDVALHISGNINQDMEQAKYQEGVAKTYTDYSDKNPDFQEKWQSGELQRYMQEHPGHTLISAHGMLKRQQAVDKAVAAKTTSAPTTDADSRLQNVERHGGLNAVIARRLEERRTRGQGGTS